LDDPSAGTTQDLISTAQPRALLDRARPDSARFRVVDARWGAQPPGPRERFVKCHIPGASFVDLDTELSRPQPRGPGGRHRLPTPEMLARLQARLGIDEETQVIAYDEGSGLASTWLWFHLRRAGHRRVSLLDGGLAAWTRAGLPVESGPDESAPTAEAPRAGREQKSAPEPKGLRREPASRVPSAIVERARIAELVRDHRDPDGPLLLDLRAAERYRGEFEPLDPVAGHIPGAVNLPFTSLQRAPDDPRWKTPEELRAVLGKAGVTPGREVIASCGSGITACNALFALKLAGLGEGRLYAGSWSDWISAPGAPIARGSDPG
jgi:thiosulfate/3-mercaptopyruvate sulfurtransferase